MARCARLKMGGAGAGEAWYHLHARTAGQRGEYPLEKPLCRNRLLQLLRHFSSAYYCEVAAFSVMGNHYHAVVRFEGFREVDRDELRQRAQVLYPKSQKLLEGWTEDKWQRFHERLFDVSELMRNVQAAFARWYNATFDRRGRFWADRFKSTLLEPGQAVLDCMLYVDLNPVRAGLVKRPEEHEGTSVYYRHIRKAHWLMPLTDGLKGLAESPRESAATRGAATGSGTMRARKGSGATAAGLKQWGLKASGASAAVMKAAATKEYRCLLYHRGAVPSRQRQGRIPQWVLAAEEARGFEQAGVYRKRLRYFVDGVVVGSEGFVRNQLMQLRRVGHYLRRTNPIGHSVGVHKSLREQRSHAVVF